MKKHILLGTTNQAKIRVVQAALKSLPIEILTLDDLNIHIDVREDGQSTEENAEKKARAYFAESRIPTLAIDGGLHIEKLPEQKQPGIFIKRIPGTKQDATGAEVLDYYKRELEKVGEESIGVWKGSVVLMISNEKSFSDTLFFETVLTSKRKGDVRIGAPLDALTIDPVTGKYYSEMTWKERPDAGWIFEFVKRHIDELGGRSGCP
jgi:8-oxo-dGTP diphosphatase